jgi:hypothetical protein
MTAQRVVSITTESGERLAVSQQRHPSRSYGMSFHTSFDEPTARIARTVTNGAALRVFMVLPAHLSYTVFKRLDQRKLGSELGLDGSAVSRALKQLHQLGAVEKRGAGAHIEWKLSPDYGWRGDVDSFHAEQRRRGSKAPAKPSPGLPNVAEGIFPVTTTAPAPKGNIHQTRLRLLTPLKANRPETET